TTIFNALTGSRQHVGNYPGVTVEKKAGVRLHHGVWLDIVDLPGTYSLTGYSIDELVAREFVIDEHPDVVVDVLDASNLERNLYLAVQFLELGVPLVLVLNMSDIAAARGYVFDLEHLSHLLGGVPLVPAVGNRGEGIDAILDATVAVATRARPERQVPLTYGPEIDREIAHLAGLMEPDAQRLAPRRPPWVALKLLENDPRIRERVGEQCRHADDVLQAADAAVDRLGRILGDEPQIVIADRRYGFISGACQETVRATVESRHTRSDQIDAVLTHPVLGLPIFLGLMYLVFWATFRLGQYPMGGIDALFQWIGQAVWGLWPAGSDSLLRSLLVDGVIHGVGGVLVFFAEHPHPVPGHRRARGLRLHGPGGVHRRSMDAQDRAARQEFHPDDPRVWVYGAGDHGDAGAREPARPPDDDAHPAADELQRPVPHLRDVRRGAVPGEMADPAGLVDVRPGRGGGRGAGQGPAEHAVPRRDRAVRDGTAPVPPSDDPGSFNSYVAAWMDVR
ncbi:MAG: ferrous iron transporter B, partial [Planctomycetota bacterium]|nr:ferrous iron transporter B [Planctomycetota bacterium]